MDEAQEAAEEAAEEVQEILWRGAHPMLADMEREQALLEAKIGLRYGNVPTAVTAKLVVALEHAHAQIALLQKKMT